jgi:hypothetical protein
MLITCFARPRPLLTIELSCDRFDDDAVAEPLAGAVAVAAGAAVAVVGATVVVGAVATVVLGTFGRSAVRLLAASAL